MNTAEKIAVMQAFLDGKTIQLRGYHQKHWTDFVGKKELQWDWADFDYRIKPDRLEEAFKIYTDARDNAPVGVCVSDAVKIGLKAVLDAKL